MLDNSTNYHDGWDYIEYDINLTKNGKHCTHPIREYDETTDELYCYECGDVIEETEDY